MQPVHLILLILLAIGVGMILSTFFVAVRRRNWQRHSFSAGRAASNADHAVRIRALNDDIARAKGKAADIETAARLERDAIMQDADARIALFARRANPFSQQDHSTLQRIIGQLRSAAEMHNMLGATESARWAREAVSHCEGLAQRLADALQAAAAVSILPVTSLPLAFLLDPRRLIHGHHFVVDLETESPKPNAAITSIGVVYVHIPENSAGHVATSTFYARTDHGGTGVSDSDTLKWWATQSAEARAEVDGTLPRIPLAQALQQLAAFMAQACPSQGHRLVWGNGSSFDNVILNTAFAAHDQATPWDFWNDRDLRTLLALFPGSKTAVQFEGIRHHALHDAQHEAQLLIGCLQALLGSAPALALQESAAA